MKNLNMFIICLILVVASSAIFISDVGADSNGILSIDTCTYDSTTNELTLDGKSSSVDLRAYLGDSTNSRVTPYYSILCKDDKFSCKLTMPIDISISGCKLVIFDARSTGKILTTDIVVISSIQATGISLDKNEISITVIDKIKLKPVLTPSDSTSVVKWSSSKPEIVDVSDEGELIPKLYSSDVYVDITATAGTVSATCKVKVNYADVPLLKYLHNMVVGESQSISMTLPEGFDGNDVQWRISGNEVKINGSGEEITVVAEYEGKVTITAIVGGLYRSTCILDIGPRPITNDTYVFNLRILSMDDAEKADVGTSGFNAMDLSNGIVLSAYGSNAGSALENALNQQGIPCEFYSGGNIKYWVNQIFGLKQFQYPNGDWKYWIQYHDQSTYPESSSYNEWTLGHYTKGGTFDLIYGITNLDGQVVDPGEHESEDITENPDGSKTIVEIKGDGSSTETTISSDGKTETVVEKDANGNLTSSTVTKKNDDGSIDSTKTNADGSKEIINVSAPETTKADDGTIKTEQITTKVGTDSEGNITGSSETTLTVVENNDGSGISIQLEINKDANGNTTGSSEMIEVKDANGNTTSASEVKKDANGNETYSKVSEFNPENTYKDSDNNDVTEKSSTVTEKDSTGMITIVEESSKKVVKENGEKEIENIKFETITNPAGKTTSTKTIENTKEDADSIIKSISTETKAADGNESKEKKVEVESKDGNVKSVVEISNGADKADIITTVKTDSNDGNNAVTKEQIEQAIVIQGKVSDEIKDDVKDHSKVIQIESSAPDASLTVPKDAIKAASDANSSLRIVSEKGSIAASDTVLSNMLVEEEITISISEAKDEHINNAQRENIPDGAVVVDVRIMAGDKDLGKSLGGLITISIRYTPADGKIGVAYHIDDDGNKVRMGGIYDPIKGEIVFDSTHCSLYMVVDEDPSKSGLSNATIFVGIAVAVVAAIAVAIMLYVRKR